MKIYSKTHSIYGLATLALVLALDARGKPVSKTAVVNHPAGTVLDMPDADAQDLIDRGMATEYKEEDHKDAPKGQAIVERVQLQTALPEGASVPAVVRQDETLNDGPKSPATGAQVLFDTKDADAIEAEKQAALAASKAAAATGNSTQKTPEQLAAEKEAADKAAAETAKTAGK